MDWIKVSDKTIIPKNNVWYWVTIDFLGTRAIEEAEFKNGRWYDKNHLEEDIIAWYPVERPEPCLDDVEMQDKDTSSECKLEPEEAARISEIFSNYFQEHSQKLDKVSSKEYQVWLYDYFLNKKVLSDESFLYEEDSINRENSMLLSYLYEYIGTLGKSAYYDEEGWEHFIFRIKDKCFDICTICGQGAITYVEECKENINAICFDEKG